MAGHFSAWRREPEPGPRRGWAFGLMFALLAPAILWPFALYLNYGLASHACFPAGSPLPSQRWSGLPDVLKVFNIVCLLTGLGALAVATFDWRRARHAAAAPTSSGERNQAESVLGSLALAALLVALVLCVGLFVNGLSIWLISRCALA